MVRRFLVRFFSNKIINKFMSLQGNTIVILTFVVLITTGTLLLMLPIATQDGKGLLWINALFTSTSASCVTGLTVVDVKNDLTVFGKVVMLLLIQAGGLGIMTFSTIVSVALGKKINLRERLVIQEALNQDEPSGVVKLTLKVVKYTFAIEFIFGLILSWHFYEEFGADCVGYGFFHSVSAFCNAGFDLMGHYDSLVNYSSDVVLNISIMLLIVLGGLGFPVLDDIRRKRSWEKLALHSKIVLVSTGVLIFGGALLLYLFEFNNPETLANRPVLDQIFIPLFQSVSARTAGFNSIDLSKLREVSLGFLSFLMFVGASPSSTGGGIKTTTFAVILLSTWATLKGGSHVVIFGRAINRSMVAKAMTVFTLVMMWVLAAFFVLLIVDNGQHPFSFILFETLSAYGTVGLGIGITNDWNVFAKLVLVATMFLGRVGILSFVLSLMEPKQECIKYPSEHIMIG